MRSSCEPIEPSLGTGRSWGPGARSPAAALDPPSGGPMGVNVTDPGSGIARPVVEKGEAVSYGNAGETVVGASGSFLERKSDQAALPAASPRWLWKACR